MQEEEMLETEEMAKMEGMPMRLLAGMEEKEDQVAEVGGVPLVAKVVLEVVVVAGAMEYVVQLAIISMEPVSLAKTV